MIAIVTITAPGPVSDVIVTLTLSPETEAEERAGSGQWRDSGHLHRSQVRRAGTSGHQTVSRSQYATIRGISTSCGVGVGAPDQ